MMSASSSSVQTSRKTTLQFPNIYIILTVFIVFVTALTWIVPAGNYERVELANGGMTVVAGSYQLVEQSPVRFMSFMTAIPVGLKEASSVVFLTLLVGGSVGVIKRAGVIHLGITQLMRILGRRVDLMIPTLMIFFGISSAFIGTPKLCIAYLPIVLPLMLKLGYDSITATAMVLLPTTLGFAFGITIPGTIGIGHLLAGLPMFSGAWYRFIFFVLIQVFSIAFVLRYARRVKQTPQLGLNYEEDCKLANELKLGANDKQEQFTSRQKLSGLVTLGLFVVIIGSVLKFQFGFEEISGLFLGMAVVSALAAGRKANQLCIDFNDSFKEILVGAMICGVARGVSVILTEGNIMDTIVFWLANIVESLPGSLTAVGILMAQAFFNFLVPSGSGQTLITMPILIPLADLVGLTRQVVVLASHWGDGITNILFPTSGYFVATLALSRVSLGRWLKFYWPLLLVVMATAVIGLVIAQSIQLGPF